jgi:ABC-2 type transport system ATP-binding protein
MTGPGDGLAVEVTDLVRTYAAKRGEVRALDGLNLVVRRGEIHGLLGPNGAGKSTLCKVLSTVLLPTSGTARVLGTDVVRDPKRVRREISLVLGGDRGLYARMTARHNLEHWAALHGLSHREARRRATALLDRFGLGEWADQRVETFSRGMKQRVHLARGLVGDPGLLLLDEPTTGMDPVSAREFRAEVLALQAEGRTVLLATHDMREAAAVCDRVSFIDTGQVRVTDRPDALSELVGALRVVEAKEVPADAVEAVRGLDGVVSVQAGESGELRVEARTAVASRAVLAALVARGVSRLGAVEPDLEDVYVQLVGDRGMQVRR